MRWWSIPGVFVILYGLASNPVVGADRVWNVDVSGQQYEPSRFQAWPGDILRFCNQNLYRRQPYSRNKYNRFSRYKAETYEMLRKGECREVFLQNPTKRTLRVVVRDAVAPNAKLIIELAPFPP